MALPVPASTSVLIVGGGAAGLLLAILLRQLDVACVVVEQRDGAQSAPAAHVVSARTLEICRSAGVDMDALETVASAPEEGAWVRWVESLVGPEIGRVPFEGQHRFAQLFESSPTPLRNLSQHVFEPVLREQLGDVRDGCQWVSAEEVSGGIVSKLRDTQTGEFQEIRSDYLVGCDGAGSSVRRFLGIAMEGPEELQNFLAIHAEVDLSSVVGDRPATLYWITDPAIQGTFIAHDISSTWVYMKEFNPGIESLDDYPVERAEEIFRRASGIEQDVPLTVRHVTTWRMSCQIAESYRRGRILLVGDAAHRFPPTGGLGLNTGVADAHNLAWKLALILRGLAPEALLDTYQSERRPVAQRNAEVSLENAFRLLEVWMALDVTQDPEESQRRSAAVLSTPEGRATVTHAIENQAEHFDQLGIQLGYRYDATGVISASDGSLPPVPSNPIREYQPTTYPGSRLPHVVLSRGEEIISSLDLVAPGEFLLLTFSPDWMKVEISFPLPLRRVWLGYDVTLLAGDFDNLSRDGAILVRPDQHVAWRTQSMPESARVVTFPLSLA